MTKDEVEQIWAETLVRVTEGESLILDGETAVEAVKMQKEAMISDPREAMVSEFLDRPLPADWYSKSKNDRRNYLMMGILQELKSRFIEIEFVIMRSGVNASGIQKKRWDRKNVWKLEKFLNV